MIEAAENAFDAAQQVYGQALVDSEIAFVHPSGGPPLDPRTHVALGDDQLLLDPRVLKERIAPHAMVSDAALDAWTALIEARDAIEAAEAGQAVTEPRRDLTRKEQDLADAEEALAALTAPPDPLDIALKEAGVATAEEDLAQAEQTLADIFNETADPLDLELKRARIATAVANLADEEAQLADMLTETPPDPLDLELKRGAHRHRCSGPRRRGSAARSTCLPRLSPTRSTWSLNGRRSPQPSWPSPTRKRSSPTC